VSLTMISYMNREASVYWCSGYKTLLMQVATPEPHFSSNHSFITI